MNCLQIFYNQIYLFNLNNIFVLTISAMSYITITYISRDCHCMIAFKNINILKCIVLYIYIYIYQ